MTAPYQMSVNRLRKWMDCPSACLAYIRGAYKPRPTQAMLVGQYVTTALFYPAKLEAWQRENAAAITAKRGGELLKAFVDAAGVVEQARADADFMAGLQGEPEPEIYFALDGVTWLAKPDVVQAETGTLVDLKRVAQLTVFDEGIRRRVPFYDGRLGSSYWSQMAIYRAAFKARFGEYPSNVALACLIGESPVARRIYLMADEARFQAECIVASEVQTLVLDALQNGTTRRGIQVWDSQRGEFFEPDGGECDCAWCRGGPCRNVTARSAQ